MSYYHVYIDRDGDETVEIDMSREDLIKHIIQPYSQNRKFLCKGTIIHPSEITTIRIIETEKPASELFPLDKRGVTMVNMLLGLPTSDFSLLEGKGKDVTRRFIQIPTEKRISLKLIKKGRIAPTKKVFIVHGHDYKPVKELRTMLTEFGLEPIVLHEQPSGGRTLVEKLEKYSDVGYAFVILTPDDGLFSLYKLREMIDRIEAMKIDKAQQNKMAWEGLLKSIRRVARQNVIFEFGYFMGLLGRNRVCCLHKGDVQRPSDMQGIVYVPFKDSVNEARNMIIKELREAGYEISGEIKKSRWVKVTLNKDDTVKIE